jgi:hypothetical protein
MDQVRSLPNAGSAPAPIAKPSTSAYPVSTALGCTTKRTTHWTKLNVDSFVTVLLAHCLAARVCKISTPCCRNVDSSGESGVVVSWHNVRFPKPLPALKHVLSLTPRGESCKQRLRMPRRGTEPVCPTHRSPSHLSPDLVRAVRGVRARLTRRPSSDSLFQVTSFETQFGGLWHTRQPIPLLLSPMGTGGSAGSRPKDLGQDQ